jgi:sugar O-acyltransferase (sialic acid O-acetyltransferase NeuD family)
MTDIIIIGAGGHAAELDEYIRYSQKVTCDKEFNIIGFLDDNPDNYSRYKHSAPLLGGVKEHKVIKGQKYVIGIASITYRRLVVEMFLLQGAMFATLVHRGTYVSESAVISEGSVIGPNANLGPNVRIGKFTLINARCSMGHDTVVGNYNVISPNVCFSGFTEVGDDNLFGINSATIPGIKVGNHNKIAAGMTLDQNVGNDTVVFYRFKEKIIAIPKIS